MKKYYVLTMLALAGLMVSSTAFAVQPAFSSRPTSSKVIYIDYDGELYTDDHHVWFAGGTLNAPSLGLTNAEIEDRWAEVAEAFSPFDVNVTTDRSLFDATVVSNKVMCIVTSDDTASPGNGGVAYRGSFGQDAVCWSFKEDSIVVVHEVGHTLGLSHDGYGSDEYHHGQTGADWAPFMGAAYGESLQQWSKGDYSYSTNEEDDLAKISNTLPYIVDDIPSTLALASSSSLSAVTIVGAPDSGLSADFAGLISESSDVDIYRLDIAAGTYDVSVTALPEETLWATLDIEVSLYDALWQEIVSDNPDDLQSVTVNGTSNTDTVYVVVQGGGQGNPLNEITGWTSYGSLGNYAVSVSAVRTAITQIPDPIIGFAPQPEDASISISAGSSIGSIVGQVIATDNDSGDTISYAITGGNTGGVFSVNGNTGVITVVGSLSYFTQSAYDLIVAATDSAGLSNSAEIGVSLVAVTVHSEEDDGELSDVYTSPTAVNFTPGLNTVVGQVGDNGNTGGDYGGDGDYFTFTVPVGYEISSIALDVKTSVDNSNLLMGHAAGSSFPSQGAEYGGNGVSYASSAPSEIINNFSNLGAGTHSFGIERLYTGSAIDYQYTFYLTSTSQEGWTSQDIGAVAAAGASSVNSSGEEVITASGSDIWNSLDEFHYSYTSLSGDGEIIAQVKSLTNTDVWAKAGVMIRESLDADAANVITLVSSTQGITSQSRLTAGGSSGFQKGSRSVGAPYWVRLARVGDVFTSSESVDGSTWTVFKSWTVSMASDVYIGLAATSHNDGVLTTAVFDNVSVSGGNSAPVATDASFTIAGDSAIGTLVGSAVASDSDVGDTLSYVISSGNTGSAFAMDANSGAITVLGTLDYYTQSTYNLVATVTDSGSLSDTASITVTLTEPVSSVWTGSQDIGAVAATGSAGINASGQDVITASGSDIWGTADEFRFAYQAMTGDGEIIAEVKSLTNTNQWAKAGVMIRESLDANSANVMTLVSAAKGVTSQSRSTAGGGSNYQVGSTSASAPHWLRLARVGDVFTSSESADGITWTAVATWTVSMSSQVYVGLAVTSHNDGTLTTAVFDNVSVTDSDIGITYAAANFDDESHPADQNIIRDLVTKVGYVKAGSWVAYDSFDFGAGATSVDVSASSGTSGGTIEVRLDSSTGTLLTSIAITNTGGWNASSSFSGLIAASVSGVHDLYFVFGGGAGDLLDLESFVVNNDPSDDVGILIDAVGYDSESNPGNDSIIKDQGTEIGAISNGSWVVYDDFDFGTAGVSTVEVLAGSGNANGGTIELRLGSSTGTLIGSVTVASTGGWGNFLTFSSSITSVAGVQDLYLVFVGSGGGLFDLRSFQID